MNIYLLTTNKYYGWDSNDGCVVIAKNEKEARKLANGSEDGYMRVGTEGHIWEDSDLVTCVKIGRAVKDLQPHIVLSSFNAG